MNEYPKKRKRKTLHPSRYSGQSVILKLGLGLSTMHLYSYHFLIKNQITVKYLGQFLGKRKF